jgi:glycosyltransferase involved in cell wall biosynthesis
VVTTTLSEKKRPTIACIPAYNEEKAIAKIVLLCKKYVNEVLVCDDGSTDMTGEIATAVGAYVIYQERRLGYDASIKSLFEGAHQLNAEIVITYDPVGRENLAEIPKLIERLHLGDADVVIGSSLSNEEWADSSGKEPAPGSITAGFKTGLMAYSEKGIESLIKDLGDNTQSLERILKSAETLKIAVVEVNNNLEKADEPFDQSSQKTLKPEKFMNLFTRRPFMFFSLPGILAFLTASGFGLMALQIFLSSKFVSTNLVLLASVFAVIGFILVTSGSILWILTARIKQK